MHKACAVHGGDGFAFVVHGDQDRLDTIGEGASQMGYGGIENSIAIEFDTWYNPESFVLGSRRSVHSSEWKPCRRDVSARCGNSLSRRKGGRVRYYPEIMYEYIPYFTASNELLDYIKDACGHIFMDGEWGPHH